MKRTYVWATLLLSFGLCGLSLTSCGDDDDDVLTEVTVPGNGNDNNGDSGGDGTDGGNDEGDGKEDEGSGGQDNGDEGSGNDGTTELNGHAAVGASLSTTVGRTASTGRLCCAATPATSLATSTSAMVPGTRTSTTTTTLATRASPSAPSQNRRSVSC